MEKEEYVNLEETREAIAKLTADRETFKNIIEAHEKQDVKRFQEILEEFGWPWPVRLFICRWLCWLHCHLHCVRVCRTLVVR